MELELTDIPYEKIPVKKDMIDKINTSFSFQTFFEAPLLKDTEIGEMNIFIDKQKLFSIKIINKNTVEKKNIIYYIKFFMENYCNYFWKNSFKIA